MFAGRHYFNHHMHHLMRWENEQLHPTEDKGEAQKVKDLAQDCLSVANVNS